LTFTSVTSGKINTFFVWILLAHFQAPDVFLGKTCSWVRFLGTGYSKRHFRILDIIFPIA
jgi:hypothetical protein